MRGCRLGVGLVQESRGLRCRSRFCGVAAAASRQADQVQYEGHRLVQRGGDDCGCDRNQCDNTRDAAHLELQ